MQKINSHDQNPDEKTDILSSTTVPLLLQFDDNAINKVTETDEFKSALSAMGKNDDPVEYTGRTCSNRDRALYEFQRVEMQRLGMVVSTGSVVIKKDQSHLIGISIGGGAPHCPCLYIVQVFDGTPASREGSLQSGDELLGINGNSVKGKTKVEVAKMIQSTADEVTIHYNKLHAEPSQGESLDIILKKIKHRLVEAMSSRTADTLGLSRAILCNDSLVKRLEELEGTEQMYKGLVEHAKRMLKAYFDLLLTLKAFGDTFAEISNREPQARASETFRKFAELHRSMERDSVVMLKEVKPVLADLGNFLNKAIPDTKLTVRRYAKSKFSYLSYCLKCKEMDDEEHGFAALQEPLYRVETGNYEYRLILRCRQEARTKFAKLRNDVLEKMELLESKHARDLTIQLRKIIEGLESLNRKTAERLKELPILFPIEVDLKDSAFQYKTDTLCPQDMEGDEPEDLIDRGIEVHEHSINSGSKVQNNGLCGFHDIDLSQSSSIGTHLFTAASTDINCASDTDALLLELGLAGIDLSAGAGTSSGAISNHLGAIGYDHFDDLIGDFK